MNPAAMRFREEFIDLLRKHSVAMVTQGRVKVIFEDQVWDLTVREQDVVLEPASRFGRIP